MDAEIVDRDTVGDFRCQRRKETDETRLAYLVFREPRLFLRHNRHHFTYLFSGGAGREHGEIPLEVFHLIYI